MSDKRYYKENENDVVWWLLDPDATGKFVFSFDKETEFNLFADYPEKLTPEQKRIFDKENPRWAEFFKERSNG